MRWLEDNKGSITVEMCFVMPVVIGVIMMLIVILLRGVEEGDVLGKGQLLVYEYSDLQGSENITVANDAFENSSWPGGVECNFVVEENMVRVGIKSGDLVPDTYSISPMRCSRQRNLCTQRLRRWQLYGNVLRQ